MKAKNCLSWLGGRSCHGHTDGPRDTSQRETISRSLRRQGATKNWQNFQPVAEHQRDARETPGSVSLVVCRNSVKCQKGRFEEHSKQCRVLNHVYLFQKYRCFTDFFFKAHAWNEKGSLQLRKSPRLPWLVAGRSFEDDAVLKHWVFVLARRWQYFLQDSCGTRTKKKISMVSWKERVLMKNMRSHCVQLGVRSCSKQVQFPFYLVRQSLSSDSWSGRLQASWIAQFQLLPWQNESKICRSIIGATLAHTSFKDAQLFWGVLFSLQFLLRGQNVPMYETNWNVMSISEKVNAWKIKSLTSLL